MKLLLLSLYFPSVVFLHSKKQKSFPTLVFCFRQRMVSLLSHARKLWLSCDFYVFFSSYFRWKFSPLAVSLVPLSRVVIYACCLHLQLRFLLLFPVLYSLDSIWFNQRGFLRFLSWIIDIIVDYIVLQTIGIWKSLFDMYFGVVSCYLFLIFLLSLAFYTLAWVTETAQSYRHTDLLSFEFASCCACGSYILKGMLDGWMVTVFISS